MTNIDGKFWDERYAGSETVYGREPNEFFKEQLNRLEPGKIIMPGDGEARNGIYAAKKGWEVHSLDYSSVARGKALKFAEEAGVKINYDVADLNEYNPGENIYNAAGLIYVHLHTDTRKLILGKIQDSVKPGGTVIFEGYSKEQLGKDSGGPQNPDMLYELEEIRNIFYRFSPLLLGRENIFLSESKFHSGEASVIRFVGIKEE